MLSSHSPLSFSPADFSTHSYARVLTRLQVSPRGLLKECAGPLTVNGEQVLVKRVVAVVLVTLASVAPSQAQSFGRNRVRYENFDFQILQTPHFDIYYDSSDREAVVQAGRLAERWYNRLSRTLDHTFTERQPIVLYASHAQFTQTNVVPNRLGDGIGGVTEHEKGRVVLPFAAGLGETDHVLGHELVHAFQRDILKRGGRPMSTLPLWFVEGMAEYLSVGTIDTNTAMWLRDSVEQDSLPRLDQLNDPSFFPYRYGQALWVYLARRFGDDVVAKSLRSKAPGGAIGVIVTVTGVDATSLSSAWHEFIRGAVARPQSGSPETSAATVFGGTSAAPATSAVTVLGGKNADSRLSVGPTLSPDGKAIAFFSDRSQYSIDMVVADTRTGVVRRTVVKTEGDAHFESLQFLESAGAWSPDGRRLVMAALSGGAPVLTILNAASGRVEREVSFRHADQVFSPTWSPDGRWIAFSVLHNGFRDLDVIDLETATVRALTSDAFADLHPAWSPDGRTIAFSTDRFTSSLETLTFGEFRLASIDVESGRISELPSLPNAKNIDPHWTQDGDSLYFVSDADGTNNVYRVVLADGSIFRVTDVSTGVSGITALSPALAVAGSANQLAFSVYRHGAYEIHVVDATDGSRLLPTSAVADTVTPPAATPPERMVTGAVSPPTFGLQDGSQFTSKPYRPRLSLDRVVQPYLTAGGGGHGSALHGGVGLSFGDMLGDQKVQTALQMGRSRDDFAYQVSYLNMRSRWNWGVFTSQVPWLTGSTISHGTLGEPEVVRETDVRREVHRRIHGAAVYPFSSAKRLELSGGLQAIGLGSQTITSAYSGFTGRLMNQTTVNNPADPTLWLSESHAALVYDTATFGPTSPILGRRYRFAVAPTFGALTFTTVTSDYRQYWMPLRPFTIAIRVMQLGRYGTDAGDGRLLPLVWTIRDIVRGYGDLGTGPSSLGALSASRMFVGNGEIRFPIAGLFSHESPFGGLPIEGLAFTDVGRFWMPDRLRGAPSVLRSVGTGVRINAAGMIFELDAVHRFDATRGWTFSFNLRPGF
jgi:Tol biopolymer transport system component